MHASARSSAQVPLAGANAVGRESADEHADTLLPVAVRAKWVWVNARALLLRSLLPARVLAQVARQAAEQLPPGLHLRTARNGCGSVGARRKRQSCSVLLRSMAPKIGPPLFRSLLIYIQNARERARET